MSRNNSDHVGKATGIPAGNLRGFTAHLQRDPRTLLAADAVHGIGGGDVAGRKIVDAQHLVVVAKPGPGGRRVGVHLDQRQLSLALPDAGADAGELALVLDVVLGLVLLVEDDRVRIQSRHHARQHGESKYGLGRLWWRPAVAMLALRWRLWRRPRS